MHVLKGIDLKVKEGEVIVIIGPSGSGKSTFLRCINHLEKINQGRIKVCGHYVGYRENEHGKLVELNDNDTSKQRREIGMVFQQFNLFPHLSVMENITSAPIHVLKEDETKSREEAVRLLNWLVFRTKWTPTRSSFPAVSSSVSPSPAPLPCIPG